VDAVLKNPITYEIIDPEEVGHKRKILYGKQSGKSGLRHALKDYNPPDEELDSLLTELKSVSELNKKTFSEAEVRQLYSTHFLRHKA
jgi:isopropylmalate/homocitrate/citramalate synthase